MQGHVDNRIMAFPRQGWKGVHGHCVQCNRVWRTRVLRTERPKMKEGVFLIFELQLHRKYEYTFMMFRELQRTKKKYTALSHHLLKVNL